jgi:hypothetical protein
VLSSETGCFVPITCSKKLFHGPLKRSFSRNCKKYELISYMMTIKSIRILLSAELFKKKVLIDQILARLS